MEPHPSAPTAPLLPANGNAGPERPRPLGRAAPLRPGPGRRPLRRRHVGHPAVAAGRAAAHGNLRPQAGRPGRVPRRIQADLHQRPRHPGLRAPAAARPHRRPLCPRSAPSPTTSPTTAAATSASSPAAIPRSRPASSTTTPWSARWRPRCARAATSACPTTSPARTPAAATWTCSASAPPTSGRPTRPSPSSATRIRRNSRCRTWS